MSPSPSPRLLVTFVGLSLGVLRPLAADAQEVRARRDSQLPHFQFAVSPGLAVGARHGWGGGADARFFLPSGHGLVLRFERFDVTDPAAAPATTCAPCRQESAVLVDVGYALRGRLSSASPPGHPGGVRWLGGLFVAATVAERTVRADPQTITGDYTQVGAVFGAGIDLGLSAFLVGIGAEVRVLPPVDPGGRTDTLIALRLRLGLDMGLVADGHSPRR